MSLIGAIIAFFGIIGIVCGAIATRYWLAVVIILSILKLTGLTIIPWFAGIFTLSAIGTGLWLLVIGLLGVILSGFITSVGMALANS